MNWTDKIQVFSEDCMATMSRYEDNYFDLAIVDPPYGIGRDGGETGKNWKYYEPKEWDKSAPNQSYFKELFRVSENQIIWGANYFTNFIPPSMGWIYWDKGQRLTMSDGELAFSSFNRALRSITMNRVEIGKHGGNIHPTQKPVKLYEWLLQNYAKPDFKILDTHLGSGSHAIACHYYGCELVATELDKEYYEASFKRFKQQTAQKRLF